MMSFARAPMAMRIADLARPLGDAHEHDVHHADPADHQAHRGDAHEQHREQRVDRPLHRLELLLRPDPEIRLAIVGDAMALPQDPLDLLAPRDRSSPRSSPRRGARPQSPVTVLREPAAHRADRHEHHVVLVAAERRLALRLEHPQHAKRVSAASDGASDRVLIAEELRGHRRAEDADLRLRRLVVLVPLARPSSTAQLRTKKNDRFEPITCADQLRSPGHELRAQRAAPARPRTTLTASRTIALPSSSVRRAPAPSAPRAPDAAALCGAIMIMFEPMFWICSET